MQNLVQLNLTLVYLMMKPVSWPLSWPNWKYLMIQLIHADSTAISDNGNNGPDTTQTSQTAVAHSASSTVATTESRIDTISGMSDLIEMLETSSQLPAGNEWTLILDGPVSELTLSSGSDGRWNIELLTSFDNNVVDDNLIGDLRNQLDTAGIAVANIAFVDREQSDLSSTDNVV